MTTTGDLPLGASSGAAGTPVPGTPAPGPNAPARDRSTTTGLALVVGGAGSNQVGAALGALAFPVIGPVGVVAVRQLVTAAVLVPVVRPRLLSLTRDQWWRVIGLSLVFSVMNLSLYASIERIGLALAVTLEFLGPLAVAVWGSRQARDVIGLVLAATGVLLITNPGPSTDLLGIALGVLAGACWAAYILLNRALGQRLPGLQATASASVLTAAVWVPLAVWWFVTHPPTLVALALATACALLSSVVPYVTDFLALRRLRPHVYGTFAAIHLVWAALLGWIVLHQALVATEWLGIVLVVVSNVVVSLRPSPLRP